ncbi:MAG: hypothetical protein C5B52_06360 [Bacteroidetes bacterium]|nr:MAG: hypothetical protein C5B52_06360 [Bacteroidota bacterium]
MKILVVPTDFSPVSINAMNYAVNMADAIGANIMLVHIFQIPVSFNTDIYIPTISPDELQKINDERIQELKQKIEQTGSGKIKVYAEAKMGEIVDELNAICKSINPFAIVMGTKGQSAVERLFLGSATLSAIRHLHAPIIVVPPGAEFKQIKKIGLACDFKQVVDTTPVSEIKELVQLFNAELEVLNVDYKKKNSDSEKSEQSLLLDTLLEGTNPKYYFINNAVVEDGINEFAESNAIDLLMVIPKKHRLLDGLFQKSHTSQLAFHSHIPIISIHE